MITISPVTVATLDNVFEKEPKNASIPNSAWMGEVSAYFRLKDPVQRNPLVALFQGSTPDGKLHLFAGEAKESAPDGWLIQFTAPPTVRDLWAMAPGRDRAEIEACQEHGARYCLYSLERSFRGAPKGRIETQIPGVSIAVAPSDPLKQTVPQLQTDAFLPNLHMPTHGKAERIPLLLETLEKKATALNALYNEKLFGRLHWSLGLEFVNEGSKDGRLVGVPGTLDFTQEHAGKRPSGISRQLHTPLTLKFQEWQSRIEGQGWSQKDANALLKFSRGKKSIWSGFNQATIEKQKKSPIESETPKKVTKTLFKTTTTTHSY